MIVKKSQDEIVGYLEDSSNFRKGSAEALYVPESESEVVEVLKDSSAARIPVTISGGGTGTVAGRIPVGGRVLSMERSGAAISVFPEKKRAVLQGGAVVENLLRLLENDNLFYPPFPTERTAFISGNVSTNASGEYSFRFGPTRRYVRRVRVVLSDGEIVNLRRGEVLADSGGRLKIGSKQVKIPSYVTPDIKCSAGYFSRTGMDAVDLFIGSEGTLGVFVEIEVDIIPALPPRMIMVFFFDGENRLFEFLSLVKNDPALTALCLEYFDRRALDFLVPDFPNISSRAGFAVYVEAQADSLEHWLAAVEGYPIIDTWVGEDSASYQKLIDLRHKLPENVNAYFKHIKSQKVSLDFAVPESRFAELYAYYQTVRRENRDLETVLFGHIGENHLHFNYFPKDEPEKERVKTLYREAALKVISMGDTIAAEHGVGKLKYPYLKLMYGEQGIREMVAVKKVLDPAGILGLDTVFPRTLLA